MKNNYSGNEVGFDQDHNNTLGVEQPETANKQRWVSPQLKEFGNLSFVVKGISYNPLDGLTNLTP